MKIIHITPSYKPAYIYGGPILSVSKLCETLAFSGQNVRVFTTTANGNNELNKKLDIIDGVPVVFFKRITKDPFHFSPALLWAVYKDAQKSGPEIAFHIHSWWNLVAVTSCIIAKLMKIPVVLSPRGMLTEYSLRSRNGTIKKLFHKTCGHHLIAYCIIHATSELEKNDVLSIAEPKSIHVIPNFLNTNGSNKRVPPELNKTQESAFKLLFLSRIEEKKGLELLFYALTECKFSWRLTIAGTGEAHYIHTLTQLANALGICEMITWVGHIPEHEKYDLISSHHLLVLLSFNENFANVVMESLSVGTAVAVSNMVGLANFVKKFNLGWVTSLDPLHIINALTEAYWNKHKRTNIAQSAPFIVRTYFNEQAILKQYQDLYRIAID